MISARFRREMRKRLALLLILPVLLCSGCGTKTEITVTMPGDSTESSQSGDEVQSFPSNTFGEDLTEENEEKTNESDDNDSDALRNVGSTGHATLNGDDSPTVRDSDSGTFSENGIYSYLQGITSYENGLEWSGDWSEIETGGRLFSSFGCGLCCLANMCCTLTGNIVTPGDMYYQAKEETTYSPGWGGGAIAWDELSDMCTILGMPGTLKRQPDDYADFQADMKNARTILVLVSSYSDDAIWKGVEGHYANIWLYDESDDTVFLTCSLGKTHNRTRVSLRDIYNALYGGNDWSYLMVE